jgi:hypothetical protein
VQRRDDGQLDDEELGADLRADPVSWLDLQLVGSWDLVHKGLAETRASAQAHDDDGSALQLFASRRVAAHLLPATSLFSVISDAPSSELGSDGLLHLFPRLDVGATLALEARDDDLGYRTAARTTLRFGDEPGAVGGDLSVEATRRKLGRDGYTGCVVRVQWPIARRLFAHASAELVAADHPGDRGAVWPWTRVGARYALGESWSLAGAVGAKASPEREHEIEGLLRVSYAAAVSP